MYLSLSVLLLEPSRTTCVLDSIHSHLCLDASQQIPSLYVFKTSLSEIISNSTYTWLYSPLKETNNFSFLTTNGPIPLPLHTKNLLFYDFHFSP